VRTRGNPRIDVNQAGATLACRFGDPRRKCRHSKQLLLYLTFRHFDGAAFIMAGLPFALVGSSWYVYLPGHNRRWRVRWASSHWTASPPSSGW